MKIIARNTVILQSSLRFNESRTEVSYQANTELLIEGNTYTDLFTPRTVFDLRCLVSKIKDIETVTKNQIDTWVSENYPEI